MTLLLLDDEASTAASGLSYTDLETRVMNDLRLPTTNTSEAAKVRAFINDIYREIYAMHDWWWLIRRAVINTDAPHESGTVDVLNGSQSAAFSVAPSQSRTGDKLLVTGNTLDAGAAYRIESHLAGTTSFNLDAPYTGTTLTTAAFHVYRDEESLPDRVGKVLDVTTGYRSMRPISRMEMRELEAHDTSASKPTLWTVEEFATPGDPRTQRRLVLHPYPDDTYRLEVVFKQTLNTELTGTTRPYLPDEFVYLLVYGALARGYPIMLNDLQRGTYFQALYDQLLAKMIGIQRERTDDPAMIQPRDSWRRFYTRSRRITTATADLGDMFDRWPSR